MNKIIKAFLLSFVALNIITLIAAFFFPKEYTVTQSLEIQAPIEKVFPLVADFSKWKEWSPWYQVEPIAHYDQVGTMASINSQLKWDGRIIGKGAMTLSKIENFKKIVMNLKFEKPRKMESVSEFTFEPKGQSTLVTWTDQGSLSYPIGRIFKKYIVAMLGKDFEQGLTNLQTRAQKP